MACARLVLHGHLGVEPMDVVQLHLRHAQALARGLRRGDAALGRHRVAVHGRHVLGGELELVAGDGAGGDGVAQHGLVVLGAAVRQLAVVGL